MRCNKPWALAALLLAASCTSPEPKTATEIIVEIDAEPGVRAMVARVGSLRVVVEGNDGVVDLTDRVERLDETVKPIEFPTRIALVPLSDDATRAFVLTATALDSQRQFVAEARVIGGYVPGEVRYAKLLLEDACIGVGTCNPEQTCFRARCVDARIDVAKLSGDVERPTDLTALRDDESDAGTDAGTDAGANPGVDAAVDSGVDAAVGPGVDAAVDSGVDSAMPDPCESNDCDTDPAAACVPGSTSYTCACPQNYVGSGVGPDGCDAKVLQVDAEDYRTCALLHDGRVKCWGEGVGDIPSEMGAALPSANLGAPAVRVAAGTYHACAVLQDHSVKCWGGNGSGQLGAGDTTPRSVSDALPVALNPQLSSPGLAAGAQVNCATIAESGMDVLHCWGSDGNGQLGTDSTVNLGDTAGETGSFPFVPACGDPAVGFPVFNSPVSVAIGSGHLCVATNGFWGDRGAWYFFGEVYCWGRNYDGELGAGSTQAYLGTTHVKVDLQCEAVQLAAGSSHTCALCGEITDEAVIEKTTGPVKCWGSNTSGALGTGDTLPWGDDEMVTDLPDIDLGANLIAAQIVAGGGFSCARLEDNTVKCWGYNVAGQLGLGDKLDRGDEAGEMGDSLPLVQLGTGRTAHQLAAGSSHVCAVLDDGSLKCWGSNDFGQLGLGNSWAHGDGAAEMGDKLPRVHVGP